MLVGDNAVPLRVLVVDDCPDHTESLELLLGLWGFHARTAADGMQALAVAREYCPDVVLLDVGLPGMDGYEVARRLRAEDGLANTVLITVSGYAQEVDRERSRSAGCAEHLVKPIELEVLRGLLALRWQVLREGGSRL
jgi:CheY-like chemotaxis protein